MSESAPFMLDDVKVDPRRLRLEGLRGATAVEPRVMDVLVGLAAQGTDVVTREALERQVWPDTHVGYHALARAISQARKALHEVAPDQAIIETVPKRGYRLTVMPRPVELSGTAASSSPAAVVATEFATASHPVWAAPLAWILAIGLVMHASGLHGSPVHLGLVALVLAWFGLSARWTPVRFPQRS